MIKEDLLHYVWKTKKFDLKNLRTDCGQELQILDFGLHNRDSGPDFHNATIEISGIRWIGNIEFHVFASDWTKHRHQYDPAYRNVILHVVFENDTDILHADETVIPCLSLKNRIPKNLSKSYLKLLNTEEWIPCQNLIHLVDQSLQIIWLEKLAIDRIQTKTKYLKKILKVHLGDWEQTLYVSICKAFGSKVNTFAFEQLGESLPIKILQRHRDNELQFESLIFGQAGFLDFNPKDDYPQQLKAEYSFLSKKYHLSPISKVSWKFLRMRPANFPTIRLAQFSAFLILDPFILNRVLETDSINKLYRIFVGDINEYWYDHFLFEKKSVTRAKKIGMATIEVIIINTIVPFLFLYGSESGKDIYKELAMDYLTQIKSEKNKIIRAWNELGIRASTSLESQALIQLKNEYCDNKRCLDCSFGHAILKS